MLARLLIIAAGGPYPANKFFFDLFVSLSTETRFRLRTRVLAVTLVLVEYLRLHTSDKLNVVANYSSPTLHAENSLPLTFDEATNAERALTASFYVK